MAALVVGSLLMIVEINIRGSSTYHYVSSRQPNLEAEVHAKSAVKNASELLLKAPRFKLAVVNNNLIIEVPGYVEQLCFYKPGDTMPTAIMWTHSFVPMARSLSDVIADYVFMNKTYMFVKVAVPKLLSVLKPGVYELAAWCKGTEVLSAHAVVTPYSIRIEDVKMVHSPPRVCEVEDLCGEFKLLCYVNSTSLSVVRSAVYGVSSGRLTETGAAWRALEWADSNIKYDRSKLERKDYRLIDPITMLKERRGICMDYTAFLVTALLSANVQPVYALVISNINHIAPAIKVNNTLFVLDQVLPPMEIGDYIEYLLLGNIGKVSLLKYWILNREVQLEVLNDIEIEATDTYPQDVLDLSVEEEAINAFAMKHPNLKLQPALKSLAESIGSRLIMRVPELVGYSSSQYPLTALYSPLFREQWIEYIVDCMDELLLKYYNFTAVSSGEFWASIEGDTLYFIAINYYLPNVTAKLSNDSLIISVSSRETITSASIIVYEHSRTEPIAEVLPSEAAARNLTAIKAAAWVMKEGYVQIVFSVSELSRKLPSGSYDIVTLINGKPVHAIHIKLERIYSLSRNESRSAHEAYVTVT